MKEYVLFISASFAGCGGTSAGTGGDAFVEGDEECDDTAVDGSWSLYMGEATNPVPCSLPSALY